MAERISVNVASRLNGDSSGTYRAALSQYLRDMGEKVGSERRLDLDETIAMRVLTEFISGKIAIKEAAQRVHGLLPFIEAIQTGELGGGGREFVFAVEAWGLAEGKYQRRGYICEGRENLNACIAGLALGGWPNFRCMNLTALIAETRAGWDLAVYGPEVAAERLAAKIAGMGLEEQGWERDRFRELEQRLHPFGDRRPEPPLKTSWHRWPEGAPVAAAA